MIIKLSWSPILIPTKKFKAIRKTKWELYSEDLESFNPPDPSPTDNPQTINEKFELISKKLFEVGEQYIPVIQFKKLPSPRYSSDDKAKINRIRIIQNKCITHCCTPSEWRELKSLQRELSDTISMQSRETWNSLIRSLNHRMEPHEFWKKIKHFKGSTTKDVEYILNPAGDKVYDSNEKLNVFTDFWNCLLYTSPSPRDA